MTDFTKIMKKFGVTVNNLHYEVINTGHINDTYKVYSDNSIYILQKVNTNVFKNPEKVMHNIGIAQDCIKNSVSPCYEFTSPEYLMADGKNYLLSDGFWRVYRYIESTNDHSGENALYCFGKLLGDFHKCTENADVSKLYDTIPDFHNIEKNILKIIEHPNADNESKIFYRSFYDYYTKHKACFSAKRLVHNDVKWANVLINSVTLEPMALIDYDTVMAGYGAMDFGDAVRSSCADEYGHINMHALKEFSKGYFSCCRTLSPQECSLGIVSVTTELSARYLYDCISGENYFKNLSDMQKYSKCSDLIRLAKNMLINQREITDIIYNSFK